MIEYSSAHPCGCDPGARHLCSHHKFKAEALKLRAYFRKKAEEYKSDDLAYTIYTDAADRLEDLL